MKNIKKIFTALSLQTISLTLPLNVLAQQKDIVPTKLAGNQSNILAVLKQVIQFILITAFVIAFIMLIIGGIKWILAGGDEKKVEGARGTITAALIGLVIVLLAYALIRLVEGFFGFTIISGGVCIPTLGGAPCANLSN